MSAGITRRVMSYNTPPPSRAVSAGITEERSSTTLLINNSIPVVGFTNGRTYLCKYILFGLAYRAIFLKRVSFLRLFTFFLDLGHLIHGQKYDLNKKVVKKIKCLKFNKIKLR